MRLSKIVGLLSAACWAEPGIQLTRLPLYFEPNVGQTASGVQFVARADGVTMFLKPCENTVVLEGRKRGVLRMKLQGARGGTRFEVADKQAGVTNYYVGSDPAKWRTGVPHYARVIARDVYDGIDVAYYGSGQRIEYDFVVAPRADPDVIRLAFDGAKTVKLDAGGDLLLATEFGTLRQHKPRVYQEADGRRVEVAARYRTEGETVGFELASYDESKPLVIDPVLSYGSFFGGIRNDSAAGIGFDASGSIYVGGTTDSADFPTQGSSNSTPTGSVAAFVTKVSPDGKTLIYSTVLGGNVGDSASGMAVQGTGVVFLTGVTLSTNFPVKNAYQPAFASEHPTSADAFVAKLEANGTLGYSTYLGGDGSDRAHGIAVDSSGNAYVVGVTQSSNFPGTPATNNNSEAFLAKIGPTGSTLGFGMLLRGSLEDEAAAVAVDSTGIYVTGHTYSANFPTTSGAFQTATGGSPDAFVSKVRLDGNGIIYSSYLGGSNADLGMALFVDGTGSLYVGGTTLSTDFPMRSPLFSSPRGAGDGFICKINASGSAILYSTYLGGSGSDAVASITADSGGRIVAAGSTTSPDFPTYSALLAASPHYYSSFLTRLNAAGNALNFSTYFGGAIPTSIGHLRLDASGNPWVAGTTGTPLAASDNLPVKDGFDTTPNGSNDAFIAKFVDGPPPVAITVTSGPVGRTVIVDGVPVTTPAAFFWQPGTSHTLDANAPQGSGQTVYGFTSWAHGGPPRQTVTAPNAPQTYTITYFSVGCTYTAATGGASTNFGIEGGRFDVTITTQNGCSWTPASTAAWLDVQLPGPRTGSGDFSVFIGKNLGKPRAGSVTAGTTSFSFAQAGGNANLAAPTITAPLGSDPIAVRGVTFSWSPVAGATAYDLRVTRRNDAFSQPSTVFQGSLAGVSATSTLIDLTSDTYEFYVRACTGIPSDATCGPTSTVPFTVTLVAPQASPTILSPAWAQTLTSSTHEFRWAPVPGATSYRVKLDGGIPEMQINTPATSTIYSMKGQQTYYFYVSACQTACGQPSFILFHTNLPPVPTAAPTITSATALSGNSYRFNWTPVNGADIYRVQVVQPTAGPGGGALTVASTQTAVTDVSLTVPAGGASAFVAACNGRGCGPYSAPFPINPPGPNPPAPVIGQPISVVNVDGPLVLFTWSRVPGDNGSNTTYRLYSADLSRSATALDVQTRNNFYAALFASFGRRYDAVVVANPGPSQSIGPPVGFIVQGTGAPSPTPVAPTHEGTVKQGNVEIAWTPVEGAVRYQYAVFRAGESQPVSTGVTPGLLTYAPLTAQGTGTRFSAIMRACDEPSAILQCRPDSDAGWGPWSNAPGGPGVTNFTVVP